MKRYLLILSLIATTGLRAQEKMLTVEDAVLRQRSALAPIRLNQLAWIPAGNTFAWIAKAGGKECIVQCDAVSLKKDTVMWIEALKEAIYSANPDVPKAEKFPAIDWIDNSNFRFIYENAVYTYNIGTKIIHALVRVPKKAEDLDYEPLSNRLAYTMANNLYVADISSINRASTPSHLITADGVDLPGTKEDIITTDGTYGLQNAKAVHRNEFGIKKGTFWSPKGTRVAYYKLYEGMVTDYPLMDMASKPGRTTPMKYPMAGGSSHYAKIVIQDMVKKRQAEVQTGLPADQYLTNVCWNPSEDYLYVAIVNREQNEMKLNMYDGMTGVFIKTLFTETSPKYVEPEHGLTFVKNRPGLFVWFSERDGFNHLYLYESNGQLSKQLTKGRFDVTELLGFNKKGTVAYYMTASEDGLNRYCCSVDLNTGKTLVINKAPGTHTAVVNEEGNFILDSYSNLTTPRRTTLMDNTGGEKSIILNASNPLADYKACGMRIFQVLSTDKSTQLNGRMFYPPNFDSSKTYPTLVYMYGGPHAQIVTNSWLGGADMWLYYMAQQGYLVFGMDNRGSQYRGIEFENSTFRKLGTIEREDQLAGVAWLQQQKYVDTKRMGVYGWSFGGFMTINMMTRTDVFKTGVAGGPVIDWSMYEVMYTERYMDKPQDNPEGYRESNLLNYVKGLKGKLLVIHGTVDDVVVWQHSLEYIKQAVNEGVQIDYFVYPDHKHNVTGKDRVHLMQKVTDYFKQNL